MDADPLSYNCIEQINQAGLMTSGTLISFMILGGLLLISALISGSEAAFFSLSPLEKDEIKNDQSKGAWYVKFLLDNPQELLATILVINNFVNVGIVILSSFILLNIFPAEDLNETLRFIVEVIGITLVILLLGEVIPKIYATKNAKRFSRFMARPIYSFYKTPPISWISKGLVKGTILIQRTTGKGKFKISTGDLQQALALTKEDNDSESEHKILEGIVRFGSTEVSQIMRPRMNVHAIETTMNTPDVIELILECGHSRLPVYEETFDKIVGVLFIKDLLPHLNNVDSFDWHDLIRKPFFVTENMKIDDLLKEFQEKKVHIAMVVDEYGGTSGIVTLEDVLEEIVGDITDEFDDDEIVYTKIDDNSYLFEGRTSLVDFFKVLAIEEEEFEENNLADTLGGFIIEKAGRILMNNEFIVVGKIKLIVESSDKKRIKMIKAVLQNHEHEN